MSDAKQTDWDDISTQLKVAFDTMASVAASRNWDSERGPYYEHMARLAEAMVKVSAEARAVREDAEKTGFKIGKP